MSKILIAGVFVLVFIGCQNSFPGYNKQKSNNRKNNYSKLSIEEIGYIFRGTPIYRVLDLETHVLCYVIANRISCIPGTQHDLRGSAE